MNELINGFRNVLNAHLSGRVDLGTLEQELITCIKQEPDFAPTYGALIEARHRTGHLSEDSFLRLMQAVRGAMQSCGALGPQRPDDRTQLRRPPSPRPVQPIAHPDNGTLVRSARALTAPQSPVTAQTSAMSESNTGPLTGPSTSGLAAPADSAFSASLSADSGWGESNLADDVSAAPPEPGSLIKNRFELVDVIGRGGMGVVFKARDRLKDEAGDRHPFVAIKIIGEEFRRHPQAFRALQREARKAQKLAHPNIATVFDFERDGGTVFMHMELLEGESLERVIKRHDGNGLPVKEALRITQGLCAALAYAHQQGIIHSDFKPANAYLTRDGVVKVLDFGIARANKHRAIWANDPATTLFDPRSLGALTPAYASCEMIEGREPDPRDDIYGLAVVIYELLTGKHPFRKLSAVHARDAKLTPRPIAGISKRQWQALRRALAFDRQQRTPSIEQFLTEISLRRSSPLLWTGAVAASVLTLTLIGAGTLWSVIVLSDKSSAWFDRALSVLSAMPEGFRATLLTGETRDVLVRSFRARIEHAFDPEHQRYNAPEAQRQLANLHALLPDSRAVEQLSSELVERQNRELKRLRDRFADNVSKGWLTAEQNPENVTAVLAIVRQIDPRNALLTDGRLTEAYLRESERALKAGNIPLARSLIDFGRQLRPKESRLDDLNTAVDRETQEGPARIASLKQTLRTGLSETATLADFERQLPALASLSGIAADDPEMKSWQRQLQGLLTPKITQLLAASDVETVEKLLARFAQLLQPAFLERSRLALGNARQTHSQLSSAEAASMAAPSVAQIEARIGDLLGEIRLNSQWNQQLNEQFAKLATLLPATHPDVVAAKERVTRTYLRATQTAREKREISRASWLLARAKEYAPYLPEIQQEDERLLSTRALVEEENDRQRLEAERNGLKQDLLAQAQAHEVADALDTLKKLSAILDPSDPFLYDAQNEIGQAYLDLAEEAAKEGRRDVAVSLVQRAADLVPQSQRVKVLRTKYSQASLAPSAITTLDTSSSDSTRVAQGESAAKPGTPSQQVPATEGTLTPQDATTHRN